MRVRQPLALALGLSTLTVLICAGMEIALIAPVGPALFWAAVAYVLVGVEYHCMGVLAWLRRPVNRTGALLSLSGLAVLTSGLSNTYPPALMGIGLLAAQLPVAVLLHHLLAFPSGVLPDRRSRVLCAGGYLSIVLLDLPDHLYGPAGVAPDWVHVADRPDVAWAFELTQRCAITVVLTGASWVLVARLYRARPEQRSALAGVSVYGAVTMMMFILSFHIAKAFGLGILELFYPQLAFMAGLPVVLTVAMLRGGFARTGGVEAIAEWLGAADDQRVELRDALADALGDPSAELLFWSPEAECYVDASGGQVVLPPGPTRAQVAVEVGGQRVGRIGYDADLIADPWPVHAAGRVVALAVERERLVAELLASRAAVRESRSRIVEAGDQERRRITRDLHDGLQAQLVALAVQAGRIAANPVAAPGIAADAASLRDDAQVAIASLRNLVHGILPALLLDRGLYAATEDLIDRLPLTAVLDLPHDQRRLPAAVETAGYFAVAEAVANAVKHSGATSLRVRLGRADDRLTIEIRDDGVGGASVGRGGGLSGIADRIEAVGGRIRVHSPPGGGTRLEAELPCAS